MKKVSKLLSVLMAVVLCVSLCLGSAYTGVFAAESNTYTLKQLAESDKLKFLGRTRIEGNDLVCEWTASGFEINISVPAGGTTFSVEVYSSPTFYADIIVDGDEENYTRGITNASNTTVSKVIPAGNHTVRVIRDSAPDKAADMTESSISKFLDNSGFKFKSISFAGDILEKPAEKERYIEWIGASSTCGCGSINPYLAGKAGGSAPQYSSAIYSFGYLASEALNADFSLISVGGYGLLEATSSSQEAVKNPTHMRNLYPYVAGERDFLNETKRGKTVEKYDFARIPDCVVVGLGGNDGQARMTEWEAAAREINATIKEKYGDDIQIVWFANGDHGSNYKQYYTALKLAEEDPNIHVLRLDAGGNGGVALATQYVGHPSINQYEMEADALVQLMKTEGIFKEAAPAPVTPTDVIEYYVDGQSGGDGSLASPFTYVADAEAALKTKVATVSGDDESISARIYIMNKQEWVPCAAAANGNSMTGYTELIKSSNGNEITVEIIGYNPTGSKPGITVANGGATNNAWRRLFNNYRFENIKITGQGDNELGGFATLYAFGFDITFDTGAEIYNATQTSKCSNNYFSTLNGTTATTSSSATSSESVSKASAKSNIVINSGLFLNVNTAGISADGAYTTARTADGKSASTDLTKWNYDVFKEPHYYSTTVNGGYVENLAAGSGSLVTGKNTNVSITVNGGHIKTLYGSFVSNTSNAYNKIQYGNFNVTVNGGNVDVYNGLSGGTSTQRVTYYGDYTFNMNGSGKIGKSGTKTFKTAADYVTANTITNNISGGTIYAEPTSASEGIFMGGYTNTTVDTVVNNISGGAFLLRAVPSKQASMFMGGSTGYNAKTVTNNISLGQFFILGLDETVTSGYSGSGGFFMGCGGGKITALNNNIKSGHFDGLAVGGAQQFNCASQAVGSWIGKLTNVFGTEGRDDGPCVTGCNSYLGGVQCNFGALAENRTTQLDETDINSMSDTVVISNTIHYMHANRMVNFGGYYGRTTAVSGKTTVINIAGSVENIINAGQFETTVYCGGGEIYGHLKTTVNGGWFKNFYGYGTYKTDSHTYNGTELIINGATGNNPFINNGFNSYAVIDKASFKLCAGSEASDVVKPLTTGRPALKLTINGSKIPERCAVYGGSDSGNITGDIEVNIKGGTFATDNMSYAGSNTGKITGNIKTNITGGTLYKYYGGSNSGEIEGNIKNTVTTPAVFNHDFHGASQTGTVTGNVENNWNFEERNNIYGGSEGTVKGDITNNISGGSIKYTAYLGAQKNGTVEGNIKNNITGGTFTSVAVMGSAVSTVQTGNITTTIKGGTFNGNIYSGSKGNVKGDVSLAVNTVTSNTLPDMILGSDSGITLDGNVNVYNSGAAHFTNIKSSGTVTGNKTVTFDLSKGTVIVNGSVGTSNVGDYTVNMKGGEYKFLVAAKNSTTYTNVEVDNISLESGDLGFRMYDENVVDGRVYVKLPANKITPDKVVLDNTTNINGNPTLVLKDGYYNLVRISSALSKDLKASFLLDEALTANIFVEKTAAVSEVIQKYGNANYYCAFDGKTLSGIIKSDTETVTVNGAEYYKVSFPVSTGKFDSNVNISVSGYANKTVSINSILAAGKAQYAGQSEFEALFDTLSLYGAEAAALFYGGTDPKESYDGTDELIAKYGTALSRAKQKYISATNLLLEDKVTVKFYINESDISKITKITLNGEEIDLDIKAYTGTLGYKYELCVPIKGKDMYKPFTVKLYEGNTAVDEITASIGYYCKTYIESDDIEAARFKNLSKALLMYIDRIKICYER